MPSASAVAPPIDGALVWLAGGAGFKTVWVEPTKPFPTVQRERLEPVVATKRGLFALRISIGTTSSITAEPLSPSSGPGSEVVSATVEACNNELFGDGKAGVSLVGAVGPIVFASGHGYAFHCEAAHPEFYDPVVIYDVDAGKSINLGPFPGQPRLAKIAHPKFMGQFDVDAGECLMEPTATPALHTGDFTYDGRGVLRGHYVFTMVSNYMCGTGPGHYSVAAEVDDSALPPVMDPWQKAPSWLVPFLVKHPSVGVSVFPGGLDGAAAKSAFESPLPAGKKKP